MISWISGARFASLGVHPPAEKLPATLAGPDESASKLARALAVAGRVPVATSSEKYTSPRPPGRPGEQVAQWSLPTRRGGLLASFLGSPGRQRTALSPQTGATFDLARLLVVLPTPHFSLKSTPLDKLSKAADCLLNRFAIANSHYNHHVLIANSEFFTLTYRINCSPRRALEQQSREISDQSAPKTDFPGLGDSKSASREPPLARDIVSTPLGTRLPTPKYEDFR